MSSDSVHQPPAPTSLEPTQDAVRRDRGEETRVRLLDAAERLFADRGFAGTLLRAIARAAGTSVSATNYHFGSKQELLRETLRRRVEPVTRRRLERLGELEAHTAPAAPSLEEVLDAFLRPLFESSDELNAARAGARFVAARLYAESPALVATLKRELFGDITERYLPALARALPERSPGQIALGFQFVIGVMVHVISGHLEDAPPWPGIETHPPSSGEPLLRQMLAFAAAGMRSAAQEPA